MSLRELKKEQMRQLITGTAWKLFRERGFDRVTVADVAREAQVAPATVFNYFSTKEDLFFSPLEAFGARMIEAVERRPAGEPAITAFRRFLLRPTGLLAALETDGAEALAELRTVNGMIAASPALQARERRALADYADSLSGVLARDLGSTREDVEVRAAAHAMMGVHQLLLDYVRRRVLEGDSVERLPADVRRLGKRAFALLASGLASYAPKPPAPTP